MRLKSEIRLILFHLIRVKNCFLQCIKISHRKILTTHIYATNFCIFSHILLHTLHTTAYTIAILYILHVTGVVSGTIGSTASIVGSASKGLALGVG